MLNRNAEQTRLERLPPGKVPLEVLKEVVFKNLGVQRREVLQGPAAGVDGAIIDAGSKSMVVSMDPITGAVEQIGWLAVNVNANDVATFGVEPAFLFSCLLLPENSNRKTVEDICSQMDAAAKELGIAIVGGHCESTPHLVTPIVVGCIIGLTQKGHYVTAAGAQPSDALIMTKTAGIEGTAILASDMTTYLKETMTAEELDEAKKFYKRISVVDDALTAYRTGGVDAMHDPTEGGVFGGIHEMADASSLGVKVYEDRVTVDPLTMTICGKFNIDPLQLISSGALLIAAKSKYVDVILKSLQQLRIQASVVGEFTETPEQRILMHSDGKQEALPRPTFDQLWKALSSQKPVRTMKRKLNKPVEHENRVVKRIRKIT